MEQEKILQQILDEMSLIRKDVSGLKEDTLSLKESVEFLMENAVTKDEFNHAISSLEQKMEDGFIDVQAQITMIKQQLVELKSDIRGLERRTKEDSDVYAQDILHLRKRVASLEEQVKFLQRQTA